MEAKKFVELANAVNTHTVLEIKSCDTKFLKDLIDWINEYKTNTPEKTLITVK
jgi:hypothetical protein